MKKSLIILLCAIACRHAVISQNIADNMVDKFTGPINFSLPIAQEVNLTYSSMMAPTLMTNENRDMQTSWVGAGWSFGMEAIEADLKGTTTKDDDEYFYIDADGARYSIFKVSAGILRPENNIHWQVGLTTAKGADTNYTMVTGITITRSDGSMLKFGDFQVGIGTKQANRCVFYWGDRVTDYLVNATAGQICYRWDLSQRIDPYGLVLTDYYYQQEQDSVIKSNYWCKLSWRSRSQLIRNQCC